MAGRYDPDILPGIADQLGVARAQLSIARCLHNPAVSLVIFGASSVAQLAENLASIEFLKRLEPVLVQHIDVAMAGQTCGSVWV